RVDWKKTTNLIDAPMCQPNGASDDIQIAVAVPVPGAERLQVLPQGAAELDRVLDCAVAVAEAHADIGLAAERYKLVREAKVPHLGRDGAVERGNVITAVMVEIAYSQGSAPAAASQRGQKAGHGPVLQGFEGQPGGLRPTGSRRAARAPSAD